MISQKSQQNDMLLAALAFLGVVAVVAIVGFFTLKKGPEVIQGQVEVKEYRVSGKVPGRIREFRVDEGQKIQKGDTLVILEAPEIEAKLDQAEAAERMARAQNKKARKGAREEKKQSAYEMWQKAKASVEIAQKSYERIKNLYEEGVVTAQRFDEITAKRDAALATERAAKSQYDMAKNGAEQEDKLSAAAQVQRAQGAVAEVNSYLNEMYLTAPMDGEVAEIFPHIGELVGTGSPIMNVSMMQEIWVTFNVREDLLPNFKIGQEIIAKIPGLGNKDIKLKVYMMQDLGSYATWKATKSTGDYDFKTFEVKARPVQKMEGLRPGMSAIVTK
ncbi:HlyD family secretion protein [Balneicella halophila]|uniref:HlyD family secretion protein n=1 Tax=Balneicella halophila TaxID=1537566 RepID=A0A7L4UR10_BALHA|nr:efflux RND transporter periplasmic adaptor subunit [Balneicella halophila]PVX51952.1 HlyD family secretion protein [Balneicella halophila]